MERPFISLDTKTSQPLNAGGTAYHLSTQVLQINLPFLKNGGFIWNRPVSVTVHPGTVDEVVVPIVDVTRVAQLAMLISGLLTALCIRVFLKHRSRPAQTDKTLGGVR